MKHSCFGTCNRQCLQPGRDSALLRPMHCIAQNTHAEGRGYAPRRAGRLPPSRSDHVHLNKVKDMLRGAQADYHHQKFSMFEHVDSPARLIKEIVRPARPRREYRLEPVSAAAATASSARGTAEAELTPL